MKQKHIARDYEYHSPSAEEDFAPARKVFQCDNSSLNFNWMTLLQLGTENMFLLSLNVSIGT